MTIRHPAPVLWLLARTQRTCRTLRQELSDERVQRVIAEARLVRTERERDQFHRDAEILALMARDRRVALEFIASAHHIDGLDETDRGEVA